MKMRIMLGEHQSLNHLILNSGDFFFYFNRVECTYTQRICYIWYILWGVVIL